MFGCTYKYAHGGGVCIVAHTSTYAHGGGVCLVAHTSMHAVVGCVWLHIQVCTWWWGVYSCTYKYVCTWWWGVYSCTYKYTRSGGVCLVAHTSMHMVVGCV